MLHGILLMRKTERIQRLAEEQRILMEAKAVYIREKRHPCEAVVGVV